MPLTLVKNKIYYYFISFDEKKKYIKNNINFNKYKKAGIENLLSYFSSDFSATKNVEKHTFLINSHLHPQSGESLGWRRGA